MKNKELKATKKNLQKLIDRVNEYGNATDSLVSDRTVYFKNVDGERLKTTVHTSKMMDLYDQAEAMQIAIGDEEAEMMMMNCQNPWF